MFTGLRASSRGALFRQAPARAFSSTARHRSIDAADMRRRLMERQLPLLFDELSPKPEIMLRNTLSEFQPTEPGAEAAAGELLRIEDKAPWADTVRPGHHLVYFPPASRLSELLPDGTDPEQSPGGPFVRRMWAGGKLRFPAGGALATNSGLQCCHERISDVQVKGRAGDEKVFVTIERRVSRSEAQLLAAATGAADGPREALVRALADDGACGVVEQRDIVFMRERGAEERAASQAARARVVRAPSQPDRAHAFTPSRALLFRFSALTWNAHSIHLDRAYCRDIEGHRGLLVHGPLVLVMLLDFFTFHLARQGAEPAGLEYRNLAPLYGDEECRLCVRNKDDGQFELWVENADGGLCVRGTGTARPVTKK